MARTKFTPENRAVIVALVRTGVSLADASRRVGVRLKTVEGWLTRGRREKTGAYSDFAQDVDLARAEHDGTPMDEEEFERYVARAVRIGSVAAMKLWREIQRDKQEGDDPGEQDEAPSDPFEALDEGDELAQARQRRSASA